MHRKQFTFYASIYESARRIQDRNARLDFYEAICAYALNGEEPDLDALSDAAAVGFIAIKPNLDASRRKAESGQAGGKANSKQAESKPEANSKQAESKPEANSKQAESEKEKEKENEIEIENELEIEYEIEYEYEIENECYVCTANPGGIALPQNGDSAHIFTEKNIRDIYKAFPVESVALQDTPDRTRRGGYDPPAARDPPLSRRVTGRCGHPLLRMRRNRCREPSFRQLAQEDMVEGACKREKSRVK